MPILRTITVTVTSEDAVVLSNTLAGYSGEHLSTRLTVTVPVGWVGYDAYVSWLASDGWLDESPAFAITAGAGRTFSYDLPQAAMKQGNLNITITAKLYIDATNTQIVHTAKCVLNVARSINPSISNANAFNDVAENHEARIDALEGGIHGIATASEVPIVDTAGHFTGTDVEAALAELGGGLQWLNVQAWGAKGDNVTDDTLAIQAALDDISLGGGGILWFPVGNYVITSTINVTCDGLHIMGSNASITTTTAGLVYMFYFNGCDDILIEGIEFDEANTGKSVLNLYNCGGVTIQNCIFKDAYAIDDGVNHHAINLAYSPNVYINNNKFLNIAQSFTASESSQYRAISVNAGCENTIVSNNSFNDVYQAVVVSEYYDWVSGPDYALASKVIYYTGGQWNTYACILSAGSGANAPTDTTYWSPTLYDIYPTRNFTFANNYCHNIRDNGLYLLQNGNSCVTNNTFDSMNDEAIVITQGSIEITGNLFDNVKNKCIAIGDAADINTVIVSGNRFWFHGTNPVSGAAWAGSTLSWRSGASTFIVDTLIFSNNSIDGENTMGAAPFCYIGKCNSLSITGNVFKTICDDGQPIIRIVNVVVRGNIVGNIFIGTPATASYYHVRNDSATGDIYTANNTMVGSAALVGVSRVGSATWNPGSLNDGVGETSAAITVKNCVLGDMVLVSAPYDLQGITCNGYVSADGSVKIRLQNETGGIIDLASGTWRVRAIASQS